jgi:hypothetical protein
MQEIISSDAEYLARLEFADVLSAVLGDRKVIDYAVTNLKARLEIVLGKAAKKALTVCTFYCAQLTNSSSQDFVAGIDLPVDVSGTRAEIATHAVIALFTDASDLTKARKKITDKQGKSLLAAQTPARPNQ